MLEFDTLLIVLPFLESLQPSRSAFGSGPETLSGAGSLLSKKLRPREPIESKRWQNNSYRLRGNVISTERELPQKPNEREDLGSETTSAGAMEARSSGLGESIKSVSQEFILEVEFK